MCRALCDENANLHVTVLNTGGDPFACSTAENGVSRGRWLCG